MSTYSSSVMSKLGYWQNALFVRASVERNEMINGKEHAVRYAQLDISARSDRDGHALNKRFICVRVLAKDLRRFLDRIAPGAPCRCRLYASGWRTLEESNCVSSPIDLYEIVVTKEE